MPKIILPAPLVGKSGQAERVGQAGRVFKEHTLFERIMTFLADYLVLPGRAPAVTAAWILAAWHAETWDQFPHLAITSPEKRCGKTRFLELLHLVCPSAVLTSSVSPAVLYRLIEEKRPTLLFDEAQSLGRKGSEANLMNQELLCASIGRDSKVYRCEGKNEDFAPRAFNTYCPKAFALIGSLDGVLADRSLPIEMARKTKLDQVQRYRKRLVEPLGKELHDELGTWAAERKGYVSAWYGIIDPFEIDNDRMADLLMPLQAVLKAVGSDEGFESLGEYARDLDDRDRRQGTQSHGVRLLAACREIFEGEFFIATADLISALKERSEEPWHRWNKGEGMNNEALANLLRPYEIRPQHNKEKTQRGYYASDFEEAWGRYLTAPG
jgi:Protein of unknown function (DUF3631)